METLETDDIYRGASLMCLGAELTALHRKGNNVLFTLSGNHIIRHDMSYRTGKALVNPLLLKETLNVLRDLIFERNPRYRSAHAQEGGSYVHTRTN